jgi:hypothetical protein
VPTGIAADVLEKLGQLLLAQIFATGKQQSFTGHLRTVDVSQPDPTRVSVQVAVTENDRTLKAQLTYQFGGPLSVSAKQSGAGVESDAPDTMDALLSHFDAVFAEWLAQSQVQQPAVERVKAERQAAPSLEGRPRA